MSDEQSEPGYPPTPSSAGEIRKLVASVRNGRAEAPESAIRESELLFRHMADTAPVMIWMSCLDMSCFWFNKPWLDFTGRTMEEAYGDGWTNGVHPEDFDGCLEIYSRAFEKRQPFEMEYRLLRHDGVYRWLLDHGVPRYSPQGDFIGYIGSCIDITERKTWEDKLMESEENLRTLLRGTSQAVWTAGTSGPAEEWLRYWEGLTGQPAEEAKGWGWLEALHPADVDHARASWEEAQQNFAKLEMEYRIRVKDGSYRHFAACGVPVFNHDGSFRQWIGSLTDITEIRAANEALKASEERLRCLIESATDFAILTIDHEDRIESWSEGAERIFGYSESEVIGQPAAIIFTREDQANDVAVNELATARSEGRAVDERWHQRKDGSLLYASGAVFPIRGSDPPKLVKIARDLTRRKQMEQALQEADRRKDEFLATLAHELRNPLAPLRSGFEIIRQTGNKGPEINHTLEVMERQTNQIVHLVDDLLDIARITRGTIRLRKERIDLASTIEMALETCRHLMDEADHRIEIQLPETPVYLEADFTRISQVFLNLLSNAARYTPRGGTISLSADVDGPSVVVRVKDNGIGIPPTMLPKVFDMFSRIENASEQARSGLGIGLSVVWGLIQLHGGAVEAFSEGSGKGSEFVVRLPLAKDQAAVSDSSGGDSHAALAHVTGKRVLVVDDNEDAAEMLKILLATQGHDVRTSPDAETAIAGLNFNPEICLCDIGLPNMDGYELAGHLRERLPRALLVSLSGWGQEEDRRRSREAGYHHHLVKPAAIEEIVQIIDSGDSSASSDAKPGTL